MLAWIAGIQVRKDASGDIRVSLDSSTPCWNDAMDGLCLNLPNPSTRISWGIVSERRMGLYKWRARVTNSEGGMK